MHEFQLVDADLHVSNSTKLREFNILKFNISLSNLLIDQRPGEDFVSLERAELSMEQFDGFLKREAIKGVADQISFSGFVYRTKSEGTMAFLYNDLKIDLEIRDKAKWKSSVLGFIANTIIYEGNPNSPSRRFCDL